MTTNQFGKDLGKSRDGWIGRRSLLQQLGIGSVVSLTGAIARPLPTLAASEPPVDGDAALERLMSGNQRFVNHQPTYPHQSLKRLQETAQVQHPFATILSCADSRVAPEILFDTGVGDIFDVRVAGNIVTPEVLGSVEYAVAMLGTRLIMVLGHERCGAVTAAVQGEPLPGQMGTLVSAIAPALASTQSAAGDTIESGVVANVCYQADCMKRNSSMISELILQRKLKIVGARYDLDTGTVKLVV